MAYPVAVNKQLNMNSWSYKQLEILTQPAVIVQLSWTDVINEIKEFVSLWKYRMAKGSVFLSTGKWFFINLVILLSFQRKRYKSSEQYYELITLNHKVFEFFSLIWILPKFTTWRIVTVSNKTWYHKRPNKLQSWRRHRNIVHEFPRPSSLSHENCHVNHFTCQFCYFQRIH